jgi:co-chaperonin GroES (HSP10)
METITTAQETPVPASRKFYSLKARGKWVLVRMISQEERRSEGGITLRTAQAKTQHGEVVDVDVDEVRGLRVGQIVVFTNFPNSLEDIEELTGERDLYLVREEEIYAGAEEITDPLQIAVIRGRIALREAAVGKIEEENIDELLERQKKS